MTKLPIYERTAILDENKKPCNKCPVNDTLTSNVTCAKSSIVRYDLKGSIHKETDPVDLMIVTGPPSARDNRKGKHFSDVAGREIIAAAKDIGVDSFVVVPSVRCFVGQIDHHVLDKKFRYKNDEDKPIDIAIEAVDYCKEYTSRALSTFKPRNTIGMGSLAARALNEKTYNIKVLRSRGLIPPKGLKVATKGKGRLYTWDRAYAKVDKWSADQLFRSFEEDIPSIRECGYTTHYGRRDTIDIEYLETVEGVKKFVDWALTTKRKKKDALCFDFEAANLHLSKVKNKIINVGFSFALDPDKSWVIPLQHPDTPFSVDQLGEIFEHLKRLFGGKGASWNYFCAHNAQFEVGIIKEFFGIWLGEEGDKNIFDTMVMAYLGDETRKKSGITKPYALETLAREYLGFRWYQETGIKGKRASLMEEPRKKVDEYVGIDAAVTGRLFRTITDQWKEEGSYKDLWRVCKHIYSAAIIYTMDMRRNGQVMDIELLMLLRSADSHIPARLEEILAYFAAHKKVKKALKVLNKNSAKGGGKKIFKTPSSSKNSKFNINSPQHMKALFWDVMHLEGADSSVDAKFQEKHLKKHKIVAMYEEYKKLSKLDSSYLAPIAEFLQQGVDGRVHPSFNLTRTETGRLSAKDPNTQQVPRGDTKDKKQIKSLFTVPDDMIMVQLDFSQAEVRWLGIMSADKNLSRRYARAQELAEALRADPTNKDLQKAIRIEGDLHMSTAIDMYGLDPDECIDPETGEQTKEAKLKRQAAKAVCFGLIYGKHYKSLARDLGITEDEALEAVEKWLGQFPQADAWLKNVDETVGDSCVARSPFGRWRRLPAAAASERSVANRAARQARNTPIQAAASDFCIIAASKLRKALACHPDPEIRRIKLINTVHDSVAAEVPANKKTLRKYMELAKSIFTDPFLVKKAFGVIATVPLAVDFDIGLNWGNVVGCEIDDEEIEAVLYDTEVLRAQKAGTLLSDIKEQGLCYSQIKKAA